jgi:hypothetical protein
MGNPRKRTTVYIELRLKFWLGDEWDGDTELMLPAEIITEEMTAWLAGVARWGAPNERNEDAEKGYWHWHWSIPNARLAEVRAYLTGLGLVETDELDEVW